MSKCTLNTVLIILLAIAMMLIWETPPVQASPLATQVSGNIAVDTTWTLSGSPYVLTDNVQVASGVTLTIEPGVTITGGDFVELAIFGKLAAVGTAASPIVINNITIHAQGGEGGTVTLEIQHAHLQGGEIWLSADSQGTLSLKDSRVQDFKNIGISYPSSDVTIERNIFTNSESIRPGVDDGVNVYIRNNVFKDQVGEAIEVLATYRPSQVIIEHNSFLSTDRTAILLPPGYGNVDVDAFNNYWGTTDPTVIEQMIYDKHDDLSSGDHVDFQPFLSGPHPNTPDMPGMPPDDTGVPIEKVGGIISTNTTWTLANSPYLVGDTVQVAAGVTLTIEPGVVVEGKGFWIEVFGTLHAVGTAEAPIIFNKLDIGGGWNSFLDPPYLIYVQHAQLNGGRFHPLGMARYGSFILRDSVIANTIPRHPFLDNNGPYAWLPVADSYIEGNIFYNSYGISAGLKDDVRLYVRNNVFVGWKGSYAIERWGGYGANDMIVEQNSFLSTDRVAVKLSLEAEGQAAPTASKATSALPRMRSYPSNQESLSTDAVVAPTILNWPSLAA